MSAIDGLWIPIVTPFRNGAVDLDAAQRLALEFAGSGVDGIVVCGTTGEAATLEEHEQAAMLSAVREAVGRRCGVAMGLAGSDSRVVARKAACYSRLDADALLVPPPSYVCPSQEGILAHFREVASATDLPVILYNIPARTGVTIEQATFMALAQDSRFVAVKQCGGNQAQLMDLISESGLKVLCGDDTAIFTTLCLGGHGAISAAAHVRPDLYVRLYDLVGAGDLAEARALFYALLPLIRLLFSEPNPGPVKAALARQGRIRDELRLPMTPMSGPGRDRLACVLDQVMALPASATASRIS